MELTGWEAVIFYALAVLALAAGALVVLARDARRGALALAGTLSALAGLFLLLRAETLAAVELFVAALGITSLFLFALAAVGLGAEREGARVFASGAVPAALLAALLAGLLVAVAAVPAGRAFLPDPARHAELEPARDDPRELGARLYVDGAVAVALAGPLLLVALVGAGAFSRRGEER